MFAQATTVQAVSFDCSLATTNVERIICEEPVISVLDDCIRHEYREALSKANEEQTQGLVRGQKDWLKSTRNQCKDKRCLKAAYLSRWEDLKDISKKMPTKLDATLRDHDVPSKNITNTQLSSANDQVLLTESYKELKQMQKIARDVIFWNYRKRSTEFCKEFWDALKSQEGLNIPSLNSLVISKAEQEKIVKSWNEMAVVADSSRTRDSIPMLVGVGEFNGKQVSWHLYHKDWTDPSAREIDEEIGYDSGDGFRDYVLSVKLLNNPEPKVKMICDVKFN